MGFVKSLIAFIIGSIVATAFIYFVLAPYIVKKYLGDDPNNCANQLIEQLAKTTEEAAIKEVRKQADKKFESIKGTILSQVQTEINTQVGKYSGKADEIIGKVDGEVIKRINQIETAINKEVEDQIEKIKEMVKSEIDKNKEKLRQEVIKQAKSQIQTELYKKFKGLPINLDLRKAKICYFDAQCRSNSCYKPFKKQLAGICK